jgi:hypothetical protein
LFLRHGLHRPKACPCTRNGVPVFRPVVSFPDLRQARRNRKRMVEHILVPHGLFSHSFRIIAPTFPRGRSRTQRSQARDGLLQFRHWTSRLAPQNQICLIMPGYLTGMRCLNSSNQFRPMDQHRILSFYLSATCLDEFAVVRNPPRTLVRNSRLAIVHFCVLTH